MATSTRKTTASKTTVRRTKAPAKKARSSTKSATPPMAAPKASVKASSPTPAKSQAAPPTPTKPKPAKKKKLKLVRDSFTIPKTEYAAIELYKRRAATLGRSPKKSELLRAGLMVLGSLTDAAFSQALAAVPAIKTGRPKS